MPRRHGPRYYFGAKNPFPQFHAGQAVRHYDNIMDFLFSYIASDRAVARSRCSTYISCWWNNGDLIDLSTKKLRGNHYCISISLSFSEVFFMWIFTDFLKGSLSINFGRSITMWSNSFIWSIIPFSTSSSNSLILYISIWRSFWS